MNVLYQIIERNPVDRTFTVRFITDKAAAHLLDPQMEAGVPKLRADGLLARCVGDLCILTRSPEATGAQLDARMQRYAPIDLLHAAELTLDANAIPTIESITALPEQSIVLAAVSDGNT